MPQQRTLDRYTQILELGTGMRSVIGRGMFLVVLLLGAMTVVLSYRGYPGVTGFAWIAVGTCLCLLAWRSRGIGLPLVPVLAVQHFAVYALPIFNRNDSVVDYPRALVDGAGFEVFLFLAALGGTWFLGMQAFRPSVGTAHVIVAFDKQGIVSLRRIGVGLIVGCTLYGVLDFLNVTTVVFGFLPSGTSSIANAVLGASTLAGFFLTAMLVGSGQAGPTVRLVFYLCVAASFCIALTSLLLYTLLGLLGSICVGFFWASGRIPWRFLGVFLGLVAFLQLGKTEMREFYHFAEDSDSAVAGSPTPVTLATLPSFYSNWISFSLETLTGDSTPGGSRSQKPKTSIEDRMDNLQNLLYVMSAVETDKVAVLNGATYWIIPALLTPRIVWPDKPRTHEGQVMLNVHYGRQTLEESFGTYIAWGLLPEAYGNFGPIVGSLVLGAVLGLFSAWVESFTAYKPLLSLEGMCAFGLLLGIATSFEMVASVLVTSQFQAVVTTIMACFPFLRKMRVRPRPEAA